MVIAGHPVNLAMDAPTGRTYRNGMEMNRPALECIQVIHDQLRRDRFPGRARLAEALEVDVRTVSRYIDFMRDRLNLPVEYDAVRKGYRYTKPVEQLPVPPQAVSEAELFSILVAAKALAQYRGTPWHEPLQRAFRKMAGSLDSKERVHLQELDSALDIRLSGPDELDPKTFAVLDEAIRSRRTLTFTYRKHARQETEVRKVRPYQFACVANRWYLIAHDLDRSDLRAFVVGRIRSARMLKAGFARPMDFNSEDYLRRSFGIFRGKADYEVVIELDAWAADVIRDRRWHATQSVTELPRGGMRVSFRLDNLEEIEPWVLGWGVHATVIQPAELAARVAKAAAGVASKYPPP